MVDSHVFIDQLIANQQRAIRFYLLYVVGLVCFGVTVIVVTSLLSEKLLPEAFRDLFGIGGAFISSLSAFQVKEIIRRKEKITIFQAIKLQMNELENLKGNEVKIKRKRLEELLWQIIEKTALG